MGYLKNYRLIILVIEALIRIIIEMSKKKIPVYTQLAISALLFLLKRKTTC